MPDRIHLYSAFGLTIQSALELPELLPATGGAPDIVIRFAAISRPLPSAERQVKFDFSPECQALDWFAVGKFNVLNGCEIEIEPKPGMPEKIIRLPLLGPVMAILLHMRGLMVLHASAVLVGDRAVAFLGDKMAGKSTTAGALIARGHRLLTDDLVAIEFRPEPYILPSFPQMKFTDQSASAVDIQDSQMLPEIGVAGFDKRQHKVVNHFNKTFAKAERLYVLERSSDPQIIQLNALEAFEAAMKFSYLIRFGNEALGTKSLATQMAQCGSLARLGIVRRLIVPNSLSRLDEAVAIIEGDVNE